jgi:hypothetical protein
MAGCDGMPKYLDNGRCRWTYKYLEPLKLSQAPDELHLLCGNLSPSGKPYCGRRRHVDTRSAQRRFGDITIAEFLRRATCRICRHKGAVLE